MSLDTLAQAIRRAMNNQRQTVGGGTRQAIVFGNQVLVNGLYYAADYSVDIDVDDGDVVYVVLAEDGSKAVVVGN